MHAITKIILYVITSAGAGAGLVYYCNFNAIDSAFAVVQTCMTYFSMSTLIGKIFDKIQFAGGSSKEPSFWGNIWGYIVMVIDNIRSYISPGGKDGGSVDPSTPTPQTEVKEGNTDNSQEGVNNRPNTSLSPRVKLVDMPDKKLLRDLYDWVGEGGSLIQGRWVEKSPTIHERMARGELTVTQSLMAKYKAVKAFADEENLKLDNRRGVRIRIIRRVREI
jgi:hypothetical protein